MRTREMVIKSPRLKASSEADKTAMVQWLCKCGAMIWVHELIGEDYEPNCPICKAINLTWNSVYMADKHGNITE